MTTTVELELVRGYAYAALESAFGQEWLQLTPEQQELVFRDAVDAAHEDDCTVRQYRDRIGQGNLAAYVACLEAGTAKGRTKQP